MSNLRIPDDRKATAQLPITVIGAGLAGSMVALLLAQQGHHVRVLESRSDYRLTPAAPVATSTSANGDQPFGNLTQALKRSINLALSHRGISALKAAGLFDSVESLLIPMHGRVIHSTQGSQSFQPYGHPEDAIYSVSRLELNRLILNTLDQLPNSTTLFDQKVVRLEPSGRIHTADGTTYDSLFAIGADGAYSRTREEMKKLFRMNISIDYITHGYKELTIPPIKNAKGEWDFAFEHHEGLHIWPRHNFMLIALPNPDRSFTATLFVPYEGEHNLDNIKTDEEIVNYFKENFPDVVDLCPHLVHEFKSNPMSALLTVRAKSWNFQDKFVLVGDAAHAVVPFFGQGMNAAFEDALFFCETFAKSADVKEALSEYNRIRCPAGHALADLSLENWFEMQSKTASPLFRFRKRIEIVLNSVLGSRWIPKYSMVSFTRIQYDEVVQRARKQDKIINWISSSLILAGAAGVTAASYFIFNRYGQPLLQSAQSPAVSSTSVSTSYSVTSRR